jgi:hypothetical protein
MGRGLALGSVDQGIVLGEGRRVAVPIATIAIAVAAVVMPVLGGRVAIVAAAAIAVSIPRLRLDPDIRNRLS